MSPISYIISFRAALSSDEARKMLLTAAEIGAVTQGFEDGEHFIVIARQAELKRFNLLTSEWRDSGKATVRPLNR